MKTRLQVVSEVQQRNHSWNATSRLLTELRFENSKTSRKATYSFYWRPTAIISIRISTNFLFTNKFSTPSELKELADKDCYAWATFKKIAVTRKWNIYCTSAEFITPPCSRCFPRAQFMKQYFVFLRMLNVDCIKRSQSSHSVKYQGKVSWKIAAFTGQRNCTD